MKYDQIAFQFCGTSNKDSYNLMEDLYILYQQ